MLICVISGDFKLTPYSEVLGKFTEYKHDVFFVEVHMYFLLCVSARCSQQAQTRL